MDLMLPKLYAALKAAGVTDVEAQAAATEGAAFKELTEKLERRLIHIEGRMDLLTWIVGANALATILGVVKSFVH